MEVYTALNSQLRLLNLIHVLLWLMGTAIILPPNTKYTKSIGGYWEKLLKYQNNITAI